MTLSKESKRLAVILLVSSSILLIPLIAMKFTSEVNWKISDFIVAGILLLGAGASLEFILRKIKSSKNRLILILVVLLALSLIWAELAVGIFGTPFAGS